MDIKENLTEWFSNKTGLAAEKIKESSDKNYFEEKWLDSLTFLELVVFAEETFNVKFSADDFQNPDFATVDGLVKIIEAKI